MKNITKEEFMFWLEWIMAEADDEHPVEVDENENPVSFESAFVQKLGLSSAISTEVRLTNGDRFKVSVEEI